MKNVLKWTSYPSILLWAPMSQEVVMGWAIVWLFVSVAFIPRRSPYPLSLALIWDWNSCRNSTTLSIRTYSSLLCSGGQPCHLEVGFSLRRFVIAPRRAFICSIFGTTFPVREATKLHFGGKVDTDPFLKQLFANKMYTALAPLWASTVLGPFALLCVPISFVLTLMRCVCSCPFL